MPLRPTDAGVRLAFGVPKSGKSYAARCDVADSVGAGVPVIVVDPMHEWTAVPRELANVVAVRQSTEAAIRAHEKGARLMIVQPPQTGGMEEECEAACQWAASHPNARQNGAALRGICIHESWEVARPGTLTPGIRLITRAWRHKCVAAWLDAQRVSMLHRDVTELATELRLFALSGDRDMEVCRQIGGPALAEQIREASLRYSRGEFGWHVSTATKLPPFPLVRR